MRALIFTILAFLMVPAMRAQQDETKETAAQGAPQATTESSNAQDRLPEAIRPGHPLDPADVDILTGKGEREIETSERAAGLFVAGPYRSYGDVYGMNGRRGGFLDLPFLPLTRIGNPFFFSILPPRGFGRGGFRGRR